MANQNEVLELLAYMLTQFEENPTGLDMLKACNAARALLKKHAPYGQMCRDPNLCLGKGYCPRDPTCGD